MLKQNHISGCLSGSRLLLLSLSAFSRETVTFCSERSDYSFILLFYSDPLSFMLKNRDDFYFSPAAVLGFSIALYSSGDCNRR